MHLKTKRLGIDIFSVRTAVRLLFGALLLSAATLSADSRRDDTGGGFLYSDYLQTGGVEGKSGSFDITPRSADGVARLLSAAEKEFLELPLREWALGYIFDDTEFSDITTEAKLRAGESGARLVESALQSALSAAAERSRFVRRIDIDFQTALGGRYSAAGLNMLGALRETADDALIWQLRAYSGGSDRYGGNLGAIYRRAFANDSLLGLNVFGDYERRDVEGDGNPAGKSFYRWSAGAEARSPWVDIFVNYYDAVSNPVYVEIDNRTFATYSADGYDAEINLHAPKYRWLTAIATYYFYEGQFSRGDDEGLRTGLRLSPQRWPLELEVEYDSGDTGKSWGWEISFRHDFGEPSGGNGGNGGTASATDPRRWFFAPVRREHTQRIYTAEVLGTAGTGPVAIGSGGTLVLLADLTPVGGAVSLFSGADSILLTVSAAPISVAGLNVSGNYQGAPVAVNVPFPRQLAVPDVAALTVQTGAAVNNTTVSVFFVYPDGQTTLAVGSTVVLYRDGTSSARRVDLIEGRMFVDTSRAVFANLVPVDATLSVMSGAVVAAYDGTTLAVDSESGGSFELHLDAAGLTVLVSAGAAVSVGYDSTSQTVGIVADGDNISVMVGGMTVGCDNPGDLPGGNSGFLECALDAPVMAANPFYAASADAINISLDLELQNGGRLISIAYLAVGDLPTTPHFATLIAGGGRGGESTFTITGENANVRINGDLLSFTPAAAELNGETVFTVVAANGGRAAATIMTVVAVREELEDVAASLEDIGGNPIAIGDAISFTAFENTSTTIAIIGVSGGVGGYEYTREGAAEGIDINVITAADGGARFAEIFLLTAAVTADVGNVYQITVSVGDSGRHSQITENTRLTFFATLAQVVPEFIVSATAEPSPAIFGAFNGGEGFASQIDEIGMTVGAWPVYLAPQGAAFTLAATGGANAPYSYSIFRQAGCAGVGAVDAPCPPNGFPLLFSVNAISVVSWNTDYATANTGAATPFVLRGDGAAVFTQRVVVEDSAGNPLQSPIAITVYRPLIAAFADPETGDIVAAPDATEGFYWRPTELDGDVTVFSLTVISDADSYTVTPVGGNSGDLQWNDTESAVMFPGFDPATDTGNVYTLTLEITDTGGAAADLTDDFTLALTLNVRAGGPFRLMFVAGDGDDSNNGLGANSDPADVNTRLTAAYSSTPMLWSHDSAAGAFYLPSAGGAGAAFGDSLFRIAALGGEVENAAIEVMAQGCTVTRPTSGAPANCGHTAAADLFIVHTNATLTTALTITVAGGATEIIRTTTTVTGNEALVSWAANAEVGANVHEAVYSVILRATDADDATVAPVIATAFITMYAASALGLEIEPAEGINGRGDDVLPLVVELDDTAQNNINAVATLSFLGGIGGGDLQIDSAGFIAGLNIVSVAGQYVLNHEAENTIFDAQLTLTLSSTNASVEALFPETPADDTLPLCAEESDITQDCRTSPLAAAVSAVFTIYARALGEVGLSISVGADEFNAAAASAVAAADPEVDGALLIGYSDLSDIAGLQFAVITSDIALATGVNPALQAIVLSPEGASASLSLLVETFTPSPCFAADADGCADVLRFGSIDDNLANLITGRLTTLSIALVSPFRRDEVRTGEGVDDIVTLTTFADEGALTLDIAELVLMNTVVGFAGTTEGRTPDSPLTVFKNITDFNAVFLSIQVNDFNTPASSQGFHLNISPEDVILATIDSPLVAGTWNLRTERAAININTRALTFDSASGNVAFSIDDISGEALPLAVMTLSGSTGDVQQVEVNDQTFQITLVGDAGAEVQNEVRFNVVRFETPVVVRGFTVIMSLAAPNTRGAALGLNGMTSLYFDLDDPSECGASKMWEYGGVVFSDDGRVAPGSRYNIKDGVPEHDPANGEFTAIRWQGLLWLAKPAFDVFGGELTRCRYGVPLANQLQIGPNMQVQDAGDSVVVGGVPPITSNTQDGSPENPLMAQLEAGNIAPNAAPIATVNINGDFRVNTGWLLDSNDDGLAFRAECPCTVYFAESSPIRPGLRIIRFEGAEGTANEGNAHNLFVSLIAAAPPGFAPVMAADGWSGTGTSASPLRYDSLEGEERVLAAHLSAANSAPEVAQYRFFGGNDNFEVINVAVQTSATLTVASTVDPNNSPSVTLYASENNGILSGKEGAAIGGVSAITVSMVQVFADGTQLMVAQTVVRTSVRQFSQDDIQLSVGLHSGFVNNPSQNKLDIVTFGTPAANSALAGTETNPFVVSGSRLQYMTQSVNPDVFTIALRLNDGTRTASLDEFSINSAIVTIEPYANEESPLQLAVKSAREDKIITFTPTEFTRNLVNTDTFPITTCIAMPISGRTRGVNFEQTVYMIAGPNGTTANQTLVDGCTAPPEDLRMELAVHHQISMQFIGPRVSVFGNPADALAAGTRENPYIIRAGDDSEAATPQPNSYGSFHRPPRGFDAVRGLFVMRLVDPDSGLRFLPVDANIAVNILREVPYGEDNMHRIFGITSEGVAGWVLAFGRRNSNGINLKVTETDCMETAMQVNNGGVSMSRRFYFIHAPDTDNLAVVDNACLDLPDIVSDLPGAGTSANSPLVFAATPGANISQTPLATVTLSGVDTSEFTFTQPAPLTINENGVIRFTTGAEVRATLISTAFTAERASDTTTLTLFLQMSVSLPDSCERIYAPADYLMVGDQYEHLYGENVLGDRDPLFIRGYPGGRESFLERDDETNIVHPAGKAHRRVRAGDIIYRRAVPNDPEYQNEHQRRVYIFAISKEKSADRDAERWTVFETTDGLRLLAPYLLDENGRGLTTCDRPDGLQGGEFVAPANFVLATPQQEIAARPQLTAFEYPVSAVSVTVNAQNVNNGNTPDSDDVLYVVSQDTFLPKTTLALTPELTGGVFPAVSVYLESCSATLNVCQYIGGNRDELERSMLDVRSQGGIYLHLENIYALPISEVPEGVDFTVSLRLGARDGQAPPLFTDVEVVINRPTRSSGSPARFTLLPDPQCLALPDNEKPWIFPAPGSTNISVNYIPNGMAQGPATHFQNAATSRRWRLSSDGNMYTLQGGTFTAQPGEVYAIIGRTHQANFPYTIDTSISPRRRDIDLPIAGTETSFIIYHNTMEDATYYTMGHDPDGFACVARSHFGTSYHSSSFYLGGGVQSARERIADEGFCSGNSSQNEVKPRRGCSLNEREFFLVGTPGVRFESRFSPSDYANALGTGDTRPLP